MQHSYEALDRPGGLGRVRLNLLRPLRHRAFRTLWMGMTVSLVGDGAFRVALAWQVYALSDAVDALSAVFIAMTIPQIVCLVVGGAVSDRFDRRLVMLAADALRGIALAVLAVLSITGSLQLWHVVAVGAAYGVGSAFFAPAFDAIVPDVLPCEELAQANALDQFIRPIALRLAGPALGGALIASVGAGATFAVDAASFAGSIAALLLVRAAPRPASDARPAMVTEIRRGFRYVRAHTWLWGTFVSAAITYLLFLGPTEMLLPYVVKNEIHAGADSLGMIYAAGGIGSLGCALLMGQRDGPRRNITFIYLTWTLATAAVAGYGIASAVWQLMLVSLVFNALETAGTIVWATAKQQHVPASLLGRVSSFDWLISIGLLPVSFAITGPISGAMGVEVTLVGAGLLGATVTFAALFLPGMRRLERTAPEPEPAWLPATDDRGTLAA